MHTYHDFDSILYYEVAARKGSAKRLDHAQLVHRMWTEICTLRMRVFVKRVSSAQNIADLPSRPTDFNIDFMRAIGAHEVDPILPSTYSQPETWEVLFERLHAIGW